LDKNSLGFRAAETDYSDNSAYHWNQPSSPGRIRTSNRRVEGCDERAEFYNDRIADTTLAGTHATEPSPDSRMQGRFSVLIAAPGRLHNLSPKYRVIR
jgi:hypothetical protein